MPLALAGALFFVRGETRWLYFGRIVLQEWNETPASTGDLIRIKGRRAGLTAMILEAIGIDPSFRLIVRRTEIEIVVSSAAGYVFHRVPIARIASTHAGFARPMHLLLSSVLLLVLGIMAGVGLLPLPAFSVLVFLTGGAILLLLFVLRKTVLFAVVTVGGSPLQMHYSGSLLHARVVVPEAARRMARLIGDLVVASGGATVVGATAEESPVAPPPEPAEHAFCAFCGTRGVAGATCTSCGAMVE